MEQATLFAQHIQHVSGIYDRALADLKKEEDGQNIDAVLVHAGTEGHYFGDDRAIPFEAYGHFLYWLPINRPDQMVLYMPGQKPTYFQVIPPDFWYDQTVINEPWWADCFDIVSLESPEQVLDHLPAVRRIAFLGENEAFAGEMGLPSNLFNERHLVNYLDFYRGMKTDYEIEQLREANRLAMISHKAAEDAFRAGGSEWDIHSAYLNANQLIEHDTPYTNIVALDANGAILHYQYKKRLSGKDSKVLLIDAGFRVNGYGSDITRTYVRDDAHPTFKALAQAIDKLQLDLVDMVKPGLPYVELQNAAHARILDLLLEHGIVNGERKMLEEEKVTSLFFPHGIGHLLGIQVHDVGGFFSDDHGKLAPPPSEHRFLRLNRKMEEGMVFTIEPGFYFIPMLLNPHREGKLSGNFNWELIDELTPLGGIRFEDNVVVGAQKPINLTR